MKLNEWHSAACGSVSNCVEVMETEDGIHVRDTKDNGNGPVLFYTHAEWAAFVAGVNNGEFDPAE